MELKTLWTNIVEPASKPQSTMAPAKVVDMKQKATGKPVDIKNNKLPTINNSANIVLGSIDFRSLFVLYGVLSFNNVTIGPSKKPQKEHKAAYKHCDVEGGHGKFQGFLRVKISSP